MGLVMFAVFDDEAVELAAPETSGEHLARFVEEVDQAAATAGLRGPSAFADSRQIPDGFDGSPEELEELLGPCNDWYDAAVGSAALGDLAARIASDPSVASRVPSAASVVAELTDLARVLGVAAERRLRFRLTVA